MKTGAIKLSAASIALLIIQLALVCSVAGKYLYQRWTCPRVWTRSVAYDPALLMRGRYLGLQLMVDGCESTLPLGKRAQFPRDYNGAAVPGSFRVLGEGDVAFPASLKVENSKLSAVYVRNPELTHSGQMVLARAQSPCDQMLLSAPVYFYISEHARSPLPLATGSELWVEVTVPPKGPPRPVQLALKRDGGWESLAFQ